MTTTRRKQLEFTISFRWWLNGARQINPDHAEDLKESAISRIAEMVERGYTSGELCADFDEDAIEYHGYWEIRSVE